MEIKESKLYLIDFLENAIRHQYFGDDTATYTAYGIALDKLKQGIPLYTIENQMLKGHLIRVANKCIASLDEQTKHDYLADIL